MNTKQNGFAHLILIAFIALGALILFSPAPYFIRSDQFVCLSLDCPKQGINWGPSLYQRMKQQSGLAVEDSNTINKQIDNENQGATADWETYKNDEYGFSFKYPTVDYNLNYDLESDDETNYSSRNNINISNSFTTFLGYTPPKFLAATRVFLQSTNEHSPPIDIFSVWVFSNMEAISIDEWYEKYWYYPFKWGKAMPDSVEKRRPQDTQVIDNKTAQYTELDSKGTVQYIYLQDSDLVYLFAVRGDSNSAEIGNRILSTFEFINN